MKEFVELYKRVIDFNTKAGVKDEEPFTMEWWEAIDLQTKLSVEEAQEAYDAAQREDITEVLEKMKAQGWAIGFVSYTKKGHFIDDRNKYLNQQPDDVTLIKMQTPLTQDEQLMKNHFVVNDWFDFEVLLNSGNI